MKIFNTFLLLITVLIPAAYGANAPRGSFSAGEYEAAKAKAIETGKPIAIVTTNINSSCPKCLKGNEEVFKQMKSDYILVIDDDEANKGKLPDKAKQNTYPIYKSKGNIIPIVAVLAPENDMLLGGLCYTQISGDSRKAFKTLETEIAAKMAEVPDTETAPAADATEVAESSREWTNAEGNSIKAVALSTNGISVTFKLENGKTVEYPLEKLSEESRKLVSETVKSR